MLVGCLPGQPVLPPDNRRFVTVAGDALATKRFAGDCGCETSSKGIDDQITGLAEVSDQPLYLFERLLPRVPEFLLGLDHRHIKPLSLLCPLPFGIDQDWLPLGNNPPVPLLPPSEVRHIPGTLPDTCVTPTIVEMRLEGGDYLVQPELPCVCDEQPTLYQNPGGERRKLANLGQEFLSVGNVGQHKVDRIRLDPSDLFEPLKGAVVDLYVALSWRLYVSPFS